MRRRTTLWPDGLVGRVIIVLLGAIALEFAGSTVLYEQTSRLFEANASVGELLISTALFAGGVLAAAATVVHTLGAPLRRLAQVAQTIGHGPAVHVAEERGPREVRQVARALNGMQARIGKLVRDRTEALAAVSHDLRTPIARMRLRLEALPADPATDAFGTDLAEMEAMIAAVLTFLGGEADPEPRRPVDLVSILHTLADDATDRGAAVSVSAPERCRVQARPLEIKRALGNLVENAIRYGGNVCRISLLEGTSIDGRAAVRVLVEDDGPGIPEASLEQVFEPFCRVETSRNSASGGIGLGLAIVRRAVERDGGRVTLRNRPGGGLSADLVLPVA